MYFRRFVKLCFEYYLKRGFNDNDLHPFYWTDIIKLLLGNEFGILPDSFLLI